jgi:hypothetical protein
MKRGLLFAVLLVAMLGFALVVAVGASAAAKTVQATFDGKCTEIDTLDHNGALASARNDCATTAKGKFAGATQLALATFEKESGTGAPGAEHGTLVATGPQGTVTLVLRGKREYLTTPRGVSYIQEWGTWTLGKVTGYTSARLAKTGSYKAVITTLSQVTGTKVTVVRVAGTFGCWNCGTT